MVSQSPSQASFLNQTHTKNLSPNLNPHFARSLPFISLFFSIVSAFTLRLTRFSFSIALACSLCLSLRYEHQTWVLIFLICIWTINLETRRCSISASSLSHINIRLIIIFGRTCDDEMKSWLMGVGLFFSLGRMGEIDENSGRITEEIEKCKEQSLEKKRGLEEAKRTS
ncbi:unnamed protein product [Prunus brigantina]